MGLRDEREAGPREEHRPVHRGSVVAGVLVTLVGAGFFLDSLGLWTIDVVYIWPLALIAFGTSVMIGRAQRLEVEQKRSTQLVAAEERVRIARELHDIVAHSVSLMTVQIAAARRVFEKQPEEAKKALQAAEDTGRRSLAELRSLVLLLRSADASIEASLGAAQRGEEEAPTAPLPGLDELERLVATMREAGLRVDLRLTGLRPQVSPSVGLAVYRVVQESLTNAVRHAPGARVEVDVEYWEDLIEVRVEDYGQVVSAAKAREGQGITGMRERVAAVGGKLDVGPKPGGGWRVKARIPIGPTGPTGPNGPRAGTGR